MNTTRVLRLASICFLAPSTALAQFGQRFTSDQAIASGIGTLIVMLVIFAVIFLIFRELFCWYWKINLRVALLTEIRDLLKQQAASGESRGVSGGGSETIGPSGEKGYAVGKALGQAARGIVGPSGEKMKTKSESEDEEVRLRELMKLSEQERRKHCFACGGEIPSCTVCKAREERIKKLAAADAYSGPT